MGQRSATETRTPRTTERPHPSDGSYPREITERISGRSVRGIQSDPRPFDPPGQLADVDLILLGRVSLLRILLSVISRGEPLWGRSVVIRSSCLPESSPRLSGPARPCGRGKLAQFSLLQRFAVWWVAPPWPILPVPAVLLVLCRLVVFFPRRSQHAIEQEKRSQFAFAVSAWRHVLPGRPSRFRAAWRPAPRQSGRSPLRSCGRSPGTGASRPPKRSRSG